MQRPILGGAYEHVVEYSALAPAAPMVASCDVLITDYSSIMFDAYLMGAPVVLTVDDKDEYIAKRGMYYHYPHFYSSNWIYAEGNEAALVDMLRNAARCGLRQTERECIAKVAGACDGHSTERAVALVEFLAGDLEKFPDFSEMFPNHTEMPENVTDTPENVTEEA
jgi:CDP-glycerol glycerophosphotransferase (TagB/SpsB family)